jgi:ABC-2 type transport system ATP-binding protein
MILELKGVCKRLNSFALQDVGFTLPGGFIMGFIGPNGAGKTTTIKLILNMLARDGGDIQVFGQDNLANEREIKERVGVVLDQPFYVDEWRLTDAGNALRPFYRRWDTGKYKKLLGEFGLDPKKKIKDLSRGMKMKLMVAAALSHEADLLILDEPTSGLDAVARHELMEILSDFISDESKGVLFSTHITADLEKIADYITFIAHGKIRYTGTKDDLMERYALVKGGLDVLNSDQRASILGYREHGVGFDGLIETSRLKGLPSAVLTEPASLDELVVRLNMEGKRDE